MAAPTSLFLRGGESNFTKVLIDGIPANDIGGGFDFSQLTLASVERIEVLRQTNSVIYGSDALTGVVNISTRRGTSRVPALDYMIDGGNLGTFNNALSFGGAYKRFDYFSQDLVLHDRQRRSEQRLSQQHLRRTFRRGRRQRDQRLRHDSLSRWPRRQPEWFRSVSHCRRLGVRHQSDLTSAWRPTRRSARAGRPPCGSDRRTRSRSTRTRHRSGIPFDPFGFGANYLGETVTLDGCGRTNGHRAGHSRLRRHVPEFVPVAYSAPIAVWPGNVPVDARPGDFGRRPLRARGWLQRSRRTTRRTRATTVVRSSRDARRWSTASTSAPASASSTTRSSRPPTRHGCRWRRTCAILPTSRSARRR